ncbi:MAG: HAD-IA family hydrolase, partial [Actinomycetota bacterium]
MSAPAGGGWATVLFDLDDTLLDSRFSQAAAYDATMRAAGLDDPEHHRSTYDRLNQALWRQVEQGVLRPDDVRIRRFEEFCAVVGLDADPAAMARTFVDALIRFGDLLPGASALLDALAGRVRLGLVTNGIGEVQRGRLARLQLDDVFDAVVISGEVAVAKPDPAIFDLTFEQLGVDGSRGSTVMVGDVVERRDPVRRRRRRIDPVLAPVIREPDRVDPGRRRAGDVARQRVADHHGRSSRPVDAELLERQVEDRRVGFRHG